MAVEVAPNPITETVVPWTPELGESTKKLVPVAVIVKRTVTVLVPSVIVTE
jgi:hypothetical protein